MSKTLLIILAVAFVGTLIVCVQGDEPRTEQREENKKCTAGRRRGMWRNTYVVNNREKRCRCSRDEDNVMYCMYHRKQTSTTAGPTKAGSTTSGVTTAAPTTAAPTTAAPTTAAPTTAAPTTAAPST